MRDEKQEYLINLYLISLRNLPIMDFDLLNWFRSFDFVKYFDVTVHSMESKSTQWKKEAVMKDLREGFTTIKCSSCEKNSQWIIEF